ncbi:immunoglobulin-like domain-containing protein [Pseudomonas ulcerans]|uniref:immunoglobulin-like domain-containing protein n=1 Tax=Pseudomonas ulcerans TaxID=3115852 RepID=UPI0035CCE991
MTVGQADYQRSTGNWRGNRSDNSITGVTGGNYEHLETAGTPTTVVTDDPARLDTTGLTLSASGTVQEGGEITYTARLTKQHPSA